MDGLLEFLGGYFSEVFFQRLARRKLGLFALFVVQTVFWHLAIVLIFVLVGILKEGPRSMLSRVFSREFVDFLGGLFYSAPPQPWISAFCIVAAASCTFTYRLYRRRIERAQAPER